MSGETIEVDFSGTVTFEVADVWPDGDVPEVIDADAVKAVMEACGTKHRVLQEWCMIDDLDVEVHVYRSNPHYSGPDALPGIAPPIPVIATTAEVW